jgi:hypothetical protein
MDGSAIVHLQCNSIDGRCHKLIILSDGHRHSWGEGAGRRMTRAAVRR